MSLPDGVIYMDHAATTPLDPRVFERMQPYFSEFFGNPSSIYGLGRKSLAALDAAHETVARLLNCRPTEIVFTGGGSEADNLAIKGVAYSPRRRGKHIITSAIEHHAVLRTCEQLEHEGYSVTYLPVDGDGLVNPADVAAAITDETALVTIMYVNNEVGNDAADRRDRAHLPRAARAFPCGRGAGRRCSIWMSRRCGWTC